MASEPFKAPNTVDYHRRITAIELYLAAMPAQSQPSPALVKPDARELLAKVLDAGEWAAPARILRNGGECDMVEALRQGLNDHVASLVVDDGEVPNVWNDKQKGIRGDSVAAQLREAGFLIIRAPAK